MRREIALISVSCLLTMSTNATSASEGFEETFDGLGDFLDTTGRVDGLDVEGWSFFLNDAANYEGLDGTHSVAFETGFGFPTLQTEKISVLNFPWSGSFVQRLELRGVNMSSTEDNLMGGATFNMLYFRPEARRRIRFSLSAKESNDRLDVPFLRTGVEPAGPIMCSSDDCADYLNGVSGNIAMEIVFHEPLSLVEFRYDNDIDDNLPTIEIATAAFEPDETELSSVILEFGASRHRSILEIMVDYLRFSSLFPGDFDYNQRLNVADLAILANDIQMDTNDRRRDLTADEIVDSSDVDFWVHDLKNTYYGDANLDCEFNTADLVSIFNFAQYEDDIDDNSTWESGDFNLDGDFTTADLILAFQDAGFEQGPRQAVQFVPEPSLSTLVILGAVCLFPCRFRTSARLFTPDAQ